MMKFQIENNYKNVIDVDTDPEYSGDSYDESSVELDDYAKDTIDNQ